MKSEQQNEREREQGRNVLEITRKTKSQTKSEDIYWGQVFMCGGEKTRKKNRKKNVWMKKKTKERKENNIRNKKSKLSYITMIFSQ